MVTLLLLWSADIRYYMFEVSVSFICGEFPHATVHAP